MEGGFAMRLPDLACILDKGHHSCLMASKAATTSLISTRDWDDDSSRWMLYKSHFMCLACMRVQSHSERDSIMPFDFSQTYNTGVRERTEGCKMSLGLSFY